MGISDALGRARLMCQSDPMVVYVYEVKQKLKREEPTRTIQEKPNGKQ